MTKQRPVRAEQQGDGQPENVRELEDESGGAALAERAATPAPRRKSAGAARPPAGSEAGGDGDEAHR